MSNVVVHGLDAKQGETSFAFFVLRLSRPVDRNGLMALLQRLGPMIPNVDGLLDELGEELEEAMQLVGGPWLPPEAGSAVDLQRRLIEATASSGVTEAWFFQTGTSLPPADDEEGDGADDGDEELDDDDFDFAADEPAPAIAKPDLKKARLETSIDESSDLVDVTQQVQLVSGEIGAHDPDFDDEEIDDDDDDDNDDSADRDASGDPEVTDDSWTHGPPPMVESVPFPVDGYPDIIDELDWEDFGISVKLAGPWTPGEAMVLVGFHAMWLAPYGGRFRNASATIDRTHHSVHLWVDRFAAPSSNEEQVGHLLWVIGKLHEVTPVVHARFGGATMGQKYGGLMGDSAEPFVLGGNPLIAVHAVGGEGAIDRWIAGQSAWGKDEVAAMLRELAVDLVTRTDEDNDDSNEEEVDEDEIVSDDEIDALFAEELPPPPATSRTATTLGVRPVSATSPPVVAPPPASDDLDAPTIPRTATTIGVAPSPAEEIVEQIDESDGLDASGEPIQYRFVTRHAAQILEARATAGLLDPRTAPKLRPLLAVPAKYEHRRTAIVSILGALRDRASLPAMIAIVEDTTSKTKDSLLAAAARALGAIGDPSAGLALARLVAAPGRHHDKPRTFAANALARCIAAGAAPDVEPALAALLEMIAVADPVIAAHGYLSYARLIRELAAPRRTSALQMLLAIPGRNDDLVQLGRSGAYVIASGAVDPNDRNILRDRLHRMLANRAFDHDATTRVTTIALMVAEVVPELVDPVDLVWLTRFAEPDVREPAHTLLDRLGHPLPPAVHHDRRSASRLDDSTLVRAITEAHAIGHAVLIDEAGRRNLAAARTAVIAACDAALARAPAVHAELVHADAEIIAAATRVLAHAPLPKSTVALFERILRHPNPHAKWTLVHDLPVDEQLRQGVEHVLSERWGWQETTAREWLAHFDAN